MLALVSVALVGTLCPAQALASRFFGAGATGKTEYVDPTLGFGLLLPRSWQAEPTPALHASGQNSVVVLRDPARPATRIEIAVTRGAQMPSAFARRGRPSDRVGAFPAFVEELPDTARDGGAPSHAAGPASAGQAAWSECRVVNLLAGYDVVTGQACGPHDDTVDGALQAALGTYRPTVPDAQAPPDTASKTMSASGVATLRAMSSAARTSSHAGTIRPQSCADLAASAAERPAATGEWGRELAAPTDARWIPFPLPGVAVCSNFYTQGGRVLGFDGYLFQCVELANRFLREQWGHGAVVGNAANWFDYADASGARHPGDARLYPDMQLADDAGQGISAFRPAPGDLLVWQDVVDGKSWTSGLRPSPGHVAVITSADDTHISFMQENYNDWHYYMTLPVERVANGWHIRDDVSSVPGRIVRGWIHVTENGGMAPPPSDAPTAAARDVYTVGGRGALSNFHIEQGNGSWAPPLRAGMTRSADARLVAPVIGAPSVSVCASGAASQQEIFATGRDGQLYSYSPPAPGGE
jgi:hypothetical protein